MLFLLLAGCLSACSKGKKMKGNYSGTEVWTKSIGGTTDTSENYIQNVTVDKNKKDFEITPSNRGTLNQNEHIYHIKFNKRDMDGWIYEYDSDPFESFYSTNYTIEFKDDSLIILYEHRNMSVITHYSFRGVKTIEP